MSVEVKMENEQHAVLDQIVSENQKDPSLGSSKEITPEDINYTNAFYGNIANAGELSQQNPTIFDIYCNPSFVYFPSQNYWNYFNTQAGLFPESQ